MTFHDQVQKLILLRQVRISKRSSRKAVLLNTKKKNLIQNTVEDIKFNNEVMINKYE